jgi:hypothetical protein
MPDPRIIDLLERIDAACASIGDPEPVERPRHILVFIAVFDRCRSMLERFTRSSAAVSLTKH